MSIIAIQILNRHRPVLIRRCLAVRFKYLASGSPPLRESVDTGFNSWLLLHLNDVRVRSTGIIFVSNGRPFIQIPIGFCLR